MMRHARKSRGLLTLSINMIGWIMMLAIFVVIMAVLYSTFIEFQTIPREPVEKTSACDVAYMVSLWGQATVHPNIFDKAFLETWSSGAKVDAAKNPVANSADTADIIFEKLSTDFFIPDSDIYLEITDKDKKPYRLFIPPESASVFETCARPTYTQKTPSTSNSLSDFFKTSNYLEYLSYENYEKYLTSYTSNYLDDPSYEHYTKDLTSYNAIYAECQIPAYIASKTQDSIESASIKVATTSNLATKLRDGIYRISVKGENSIYYPLGPYPDGCIVNKGAGEVKGRMPMKEATKFSFISGIYLIYNLISASTGLQINGVRTAEDWIDDHKLYADCGFDWTLEELKLNGATEDEVGPGKDKVVLTVKSTKNGAECPLVTRIPYYLYESFNKVDSGKGDYVKENDYYKKVETNKGDYNKISVTKDKICTPKAAFSTVWLPGDGTDSFVYFLKVENARGDWNKKTEKEFCEIRCKEAPPAWFLKKQIDDCKVSCDKLTQDNGKYTCGNIYSVWPCTMISGTGGKIVTVNTAPDCIDRKNLPETESCQFAQSQIMLYRNLPEGAVNIRYIVVDSKKFQDKSFSDLKEEDYYSTASACATWKTIGACGTGTDCHVENSPSETSDDSAKIHCVSAYSSDLSKKEPLSSCQMCSRDYWGMCSPNYLDDPPAYSEGIFSCQNVYDQTYPSNWRMSDCLPVIRANVSRVLYDSEGNVKYDEIFPKEFAIPGEWEIDLGSDITITGNTQLNNYQRQELSIKIDDPAVRIPLLVPEIKCSDPENENLLLNWTINASSLCCPQWTLQEFTDSDNKKAERKVCSSPPSYCQSMKFWSNLDSNNSRELVPQAHFLNSQEIVSDDSYVYHIEQQVCRGNKQFNNADVAFITASYLVEGRTQPIQYSLSGSEVKLLLTVDPKVETKPQTPKEFCRAQCENMNLGWLIGRTDHCKAYCDRLSAGEGGLMPAGGGGYYSGGIGSCEDAKNEKDFSKSSCEYAQEQLDSYQK